MPSKKKGSASGKRLPSRKKPGRSARRKATKPIKAKATPRKRAVSKRKGKASTTSRATELLTSTAPRTLVADQALQVFTGTVRINGNQSILNGTLLIRAGVADSPSAMGAATQYLLNQGISDGDTISVSGTATTVQYGGRSVNVIVMTSARRS